MASDVFFNRVPYTQRRLPTHELVTSASGSNSVTSAAPGVHVQRGSVGTSLLGGALTFPPLYLDPVEPHTVHDPASSSQHASQPAQQTGNFVLGSTFYHHPQLNALVSNHLIDASANAPDGVSGTGHAFLSSIFANRHGGPHDDDSDADEVGGTNGAEAAVVVPRPKITSEFVSLNEDLVPASLDMHGDMLPADQHPSYPFGNLFGPLGGMIAADSAIVGGTQSVGVATNLGAGLGDAATLGMDFGGGLDGFIHLGQSSHGRRSAVTNGWNSFINKASRTKLVGSASANAEWNADAHQSTTSAAKDDPNRTSQVEIIRSARKLDLSPSLLFRTSTSTVLAPPTWPFRRYGPGGTSYAALLRPSSNIYGTSPASQAVAATLGGLPASSKILKEVWSDLALEQLIPTKIGETSATRHLNREEAEADQAEAADARSGEKRGKKRARTDPEADEVFSKRIARIEADPLDLLGPISREIRGQAARPWGTATLRGTHRSRRRRPSYSDESADSSAEAEYDSVETGFAQRDHVRYSFALPPAQFSWTESTEQEDPDHKEQVSSTVHVEPDGIGWSTAKRIFVNEERDRVLPEVASRGSGLDEYRVRGWRSNQGVLPRPGWTWTKGPMHEVEQAANVSLVTEMSASTSHHSNSASREHQTLDDQHSVSASEAGAELDEERIWEGHVEGEDAELQRALLMHYQQEMAHADAEAERASQQTPDEDAQQEEQQEDVEEDFENEQEAPVEHDVDVQDEQDELADEDVESFEED